MTTTVSVPAPAPPSSQDPSPARNIWGLGHLPALDGLRGAAVAAVLLYHGGYLTGGYLGVDLFFVLSGFLITSLLLAEHRGSGRIRLGAFWLRRARRLLPALFVLVGGVALYAWVWARPIDLGDIRSSGFGALFYVANWQQIIHGTNYWDISLNPSPFQHVWSLAIEEQFYLVWPLVMIGLLKGGGRHRGRRVMRFSLALSAVSASLFVVLHALGASDTRVYQGTDTRATAVLLGAALAGWRVERGPVEANPNARQIEVLGLVSAALLAVAWFALSGTSPLLYWGGLPLCSVLAMIVVGAASSRTSPYLGRGLSLSWLRALGTISYGLYLWHWPVYLVLNEARTGLSGLALLALRLAASLAIAWLSFKLVEQPIRQGALRHSFAKVAVAVGAVACVGALVLATAGAVAPAAVNQLAAPTLAAQQVPGAPKLMIVGDSVGNSVAGPMIDDPWSFGVNPINQTVIGCELEFKGNVVLLGNGVRQKRPDCAADYAGSVATYDPDVVLMYFGGANSGEVIIDGKAVDACAPEFRATQEREYAAAIDDLRSNGAKVALVTLARVDSNGFAPPSWNQHIDCYNEALRSIADDNGVEIVDLDAWICPDGDCREEIDGAPIRPDGLHFTGPGGRAVSAFLAEEGLSAAGLEPAASAARVPESCAGIRHASVPVLDQIGGTSAPNRRSAVDRLRYVDFDQAASDAPAAVKADLEALGAEQDAISKVLKSTPNGKTVTIDMFSPEASAALTHLKAYLAENCTGA